MRHAYAIRLARVRVPVAIAAKWMGHSVSVHTHTYHGAMSEQEYQEVWERLVKDGQ
ncbi:MAG: hypothetical protein AAFX78_08295 [Cyanobacteria bacterium J06638_20]